MAVVLARVDDRLVHGQVVEGWVPYLSVDVVVVASDEICLDRNRCRLLKLIAPENVRLIVVPLRELSRVLNDMDSLNMLLLFEDLDDVLIAHKMGVGLERVNLGNLHHVRGGVEVTPAVYLNRKDIQTVRDLARKGVSVEAREVPGSKPFNLMDFIVKAEGLI
jgi:mannose/fructose/N-acetylgalactosamine-specific phosphotransferase system component IIB